MKLEHKVILLKFHRLHYYLLFVILLCSTKTSFAFYNTKINHFQFESRGLLRLYAVSLQNPNNKILFPKQTKSGLAGIARLLLDIQSDDRWRLEFNAYQTFIPNALQGNSNIPTSTERSAILEKSSSNTDYIHTAIDRLALRWSSSRINFTLGRQAINLATNYYFTPNDFFAPFSAQTFYRVYKPGVDALRFEYAYDNLSQLSYISVLGYKPIATSDIAWSRLTDGERSSNLLQWTNVNTSFETTVVIGKVRNKNILGVSLQAELLHWFAFRFEGHYAQPIRSTDSNYYQYSIGFERRWANNLNLQLEFFYYGPGANSVSLYNTATINNNSLYQARHYSAIGGSYEISPLLTVQAVIISNLVDQSHLMSVNSIYSLSDESELSFNLNLPIGKTPDKTIIKNEFGVYPKYINIEYRWYF